MFVSRSCLPHVLPPEAYWSNEQYQRERELLARSWHLVGTTAELARPGDFLATELLGTPIQVRNFEGQLRALCNVCAHRHSLLTACPRGNSPTMRCQYHGWEYGPSGTTRKIPAPENFVPLPEERPRLPVYSLDTAGKLIFVRLSPEGPTLADQLGNLYGVCVERFGEGWEPYLSWNPDYAANWKVPVENSLEAYHVPCVHGQTFGQDPGENRSEHQLESGQTSFTTGLPFAHSKRDLAFQFCEDWVVRSLGKNPSRMYRQVHVFPNLLFSFTDAVSLCQCVVPTGPTTCRAEVRQLGLGGSALARGWGWLKGKVTRQILEEDRGLFSSIQRGLEASPHRGLLGRCEERIHAFQTWLSLDPRGAAGPESA